MYLLIAIVVFIVSAISAAIKGDQSAIEILTYILSVILLFAFLSLFVPK